MPDAGLPHLWIPANRTRVEEIVVRGGGDTYSRDDLAEHSRSLLAAFQRSLARFQAKQDVDLTTDLIMQITTVQERNANKERQHLRNLGFQILSLSADTPNVAIARIPREEIPRLVRKLERYASSVRHIGKSNFSAIEEMSPVAVARKIEPSLAATAGEQSVDCLISIYGGIPQQLKREVAGRIAGQLLEERVRPVEVHSYANGAVAISAPLTRLEMERISEQYLLVRSIESNAEFVTESAIQADPVPNLLQIDAPRCQSPVVVIDSGVNDACALLAGLVLRSVNALPPGSVGPHLAHGTFVASRVIYGDSITGVLGRRATPWCPVIDVQVTGDDGLGNRVAQSAAKLAEILQNVVPALAGEARVFNLSLGIAPISDGYYSSLARLIDYLSREHQVLFVISAGNISDPCAAPPAHYLASAARILYPSEALLALTVGAVAQYCEPNCVAQEREIAPFSRRGPGSDKALKPELVAHGGNVLFNGIGWTTSPRIAVYGLGRQGTHLEYATGTSYSAPLVAQYAARLFDAYPSATPNLVRALLCHFTRPVVAPNPGAPVEAHHFCGFGEPEIERALYSGPAAATYLHTGQIRKDTYLHIPFYVPEALAGNRASRLTIRGTVVFDPPVSLDDSVNYSLCRISGLLRKRVGDALRDVSVGGDEDDVLFPWNPLFHFEHRFRRGYASGEWELRLRLMTRGDLPDGFLQSLSVVIEVLDSTGTVDVREEVMRERPGIYAAVALRLAA